MSENYKFVRSYKHQFIYSLGVKEFVIAGDIYRDFFEPEMTEERMQYFVELEGVEVYERPDQTPTGE